MKKSRSKFLKIVDEKHDINFHWPHRLLEIYRRDARKLPLNRLNNILPCAMLKSSRGLKKHGFLRLF